MCNAFRTLLPEEIDVRVQAITKTARGIRASLLLYKDARVDMNILDEKFGIFGWQRQHEYKNGKNYCKVSVFNEKTNEWVSKEDVGVESNTEETKGESSDAFKRACVNLGIGRELYTATSISVPLDESEVYEKGKDRHGNPSYSLNVWIKFRVSDIGYDRARNISNITIVDQDGRERFATKSSKIELTAELVDDKFLAKIWKRENEYKSQDKDFILSDILKPYYTISHHEYHKIHTLYDSYKIKLLEQEITQE